MARVSKAKLLQPFFDVAASAETAQTDWTVSAELIARVVEGLSGAGGHLPARLSAQLSAIAEAFAADRSIQSYWGEPGPQHQLLRMLRDGGDVQAIWQALAPEYLVELSKYLHPSDAAWLLDPVDEPAEVVTRVRAAAARFCMDYCPTTGRRTDLALETAVRALVDLLESTLGRRLQIAGNKNNGRGGPAPNCAGSRAIELLLAGVDPTLTTTAVMNMIVKVRRQPEPTDDHLIVLFRSNPINELDASLLPGREEAIRQLRDDPVNGFA